MRALFLQSHIETQAKTTLSGPLFRRLWLLKTLKSNINFKEKGILVPFDFSELAEVAIDSPIEFAGDRKHVIVLHGVHPTSRFGVPNLLGGMGMGNLVMGELDMDPGVDPSEGSMDRCMEIDDENERRAVDLLD
jgi:hypothetical protein